MEGILRQMIMEEIRQGHVSRSHHQRLLGLAAELGFSESTALELIDQCRREASAGGCSQTRRNAAKFAGAENRSLVRLGLIIALVVAAQVMLILLL